MFLIRTGDLEGQVILGIRFVFFPNKDLCRNLSFTVEWNRGANVTIHGTVLCDVDQFLLIRGNCNSRGTFLLEGVREKK